MNKDIINMNFNELLKLDNQILTEKELTELEENELIKSIETLGTSGQFVGYTWYSVELEDATINVYCKFE